LSRDYALGWSHVPVFIVLFGDVLVAAGLVLIILRLTNEERYLSTRLPG
jgi:protein-S-isoprenylcysteine O-methyltransferase Ste14